MLLFLLIFSATTLSFLLLLLWLLLGLGLRLFWWLSLGRRRLLLTLLHFLKELFVLLITTRSCFWLMSWLLMLWLLLLFLLLIFSFALSGILLLLLLLRLANIARMGLLLLSMLTLTFLSTAPGLALTTGVSATVPLLLLLLLLVLALTTLFLATILALLLTGIHDRLLILHWPLLNSIYY